MQMPVHPPPASFLSGGGGPLGSLIANFDWSASNLGPLDEWPRVIKTTVGLILRSPVPIVTLWGADGVMIYNDAYSVFAGERHPKLLGSKVREGWPEVADFNDNMMKAVFVRGESLSYQDQELTLHRNDKPEQVWMNLDYSQVVHEDGNPAGVIAIVVETTGKVRAERRLSGEHERLRQMFDEAPGFMAVLEGTDHRFAMANKNYFQLVGGRNIIGKTVAEALPEIVTQGFVDLLDNVYRTQEAFIGTAMPVSVQRTGGGLDDRIVDFIFQPMAGADGEIEGIFVQGYDVTAHKRSEDLRITHNQVLELAMQDRPLRDLLQSVVEVVEAHSRAGALASILLLDENGTTLRHGAAPSLPDAYTQAIDNLAIGPKAGSCGTAAFTAQPVFVADIAKDPLWADFSDLAREHGLGACWSLPILSGAGAVLGTFAIYHREPREPAEDDLALVGLITRTTSLIIERKRAEAALRESEERFRLVAERAPVMLWMGDDTGKCVYLNKAQREFWGIAEADMAQFDWGVTVHPADLDKLNGPYQRAMTDHTALTLEARFRRADGVYRLVQTHAEPRFGTGGRFLGMIGVNVDITDVREAQERYRRIFEQASDLIITADLNQVITDCNPAAAAAVGLTREQTIGRGISEFVSPEDYGRTTSMLQAKLEQGGTTQYDVTVRSSTGDLLLWEINSGLTFDDAGNPMGLHVVGRDVTERKRLERHQELLVGELNHRVKNTLAIVQSLAHQSFHSAIPATESIKRFEGRLQALATAHTVLTRKNWEATAIYDVVAEALAPFCPGDRCHFSGPEVRLAPQMAVSLALALHELATNASKYGALSNEKGIISIEWSIRDGMLEFAWVEQGGPPVVPPEHRGFGTRMIERTLRAEFSGSVEMRFASSGLTCKLTARVPLSHSV